MLAASMRRDLRRQRWQRSPVRLIAATKVDDSAPAERPLHRSVAAEDQAGPNLELLAAEVALARGVRPAEADAWIEQQLSKANMG